MLKYKRFEKTCNTNDIIELGVWAGLIIVGHANGAARAIYSLSGHNASSVVKVSGSDMSDLITFDNYSTFGLAIKYIASPQDTIYVKVIYVN